MKTDTAVAAAVVGFALAVMGAVSFVAWQVELTKRTCIAAGRSMQHGECSPASK